MLRLRHTAREAVRLVEVFVKQADNRQMLRNLNIESILQPFVDFKQGASLNPRYHIGIGAASLIVLFIKKP